MLVGRAVSWKSAKQTITASSTMEAEFIACHEAISFFWLRNFIEGLQIMDFMSRPIMVYCGNSVDVFFLKNNKCSKHIELKFHVVRENSTAKGVHGAYKD